MNYTITQKSYTTTHSMYDSKGYISIPSISIMNDEIIQYNNITIKEHPDLKVNIDGSVIFPMDKKYKGFDNIHIDGTLTILEPNYIFRWVQEVEETIYVKKHYKYRITGMMAYDYIDEKYETHTTYHTKEEYENDDDIEKKIICKKIILDADVDYIDDEIDCNDLNYERIKNGYKCKEERVMINEIVTYTRSFRTDEIRDRDFMWGRFVKSILILSNSDGECELIFNNHTCGYIPFNKKFDLTTSNNKILCMFYNLTRDSKMDGIDVSKIDDIRIRFDCRKQIDDFEIVVDAVIVVDADNKEWCALT